MISIAENGRLERGFDREKLLKFLRKKLLLDNTEQRKQKDKKKPSKDKQPSGAAKKGGDSK